MTRTVLLIAAICSVFSSIAQDLSNKGKDFWVGYGYHVSMATANSQDMVLYFTSDVNATVKVEIPLLGYSQTYTVTANQITTSLPLPKNTSMDARLVDEGLSNKGIHITSDQPIVAYAHIYNQSVSGATLLFPTNTLGKDYYTLGFTQVSNENFSNAFAFVIATEDNTTVEIDLSGSTLTHTIGKFNVTLQKGQVYNLKGILTGGTPGNLGGVDLTGTRIRSISSGNEPCKKIAVFAGSGKINLKCNASGEASADNLFSQVLPSSAWGKKYLTAPTENMRRNYFRVMIKETGTVVKLDGNVLTGLFAGRYYEFSSDQPHVIEADQPILVAQYITTRNQCGNNSNTGEGDPEMIYLSPVEQTISDITLNSTSQFQITKHFINVIIPKAKVSTFKLDGNAYTGFTQHPGSVDHMYALIAVNAGSHRLSADTGFNAIAYGYGLAESYGYNAGTNVIDLYQFITINNESNAVNLPVTCKGSNFNFAITLPYPATSIKWVFNNNAGLSPNADIDQTPQSADSTYVKDGRQLYVYKLPGKFVTNAVGTIPVKVLVNSPSADGCNGLQEISYELNVYERPLASFTSPSKACLTDTVKFVDASNGNGRTLVAWNWTFGDGVSTQIKNVNKLFGQHGNISVKLKVVNDIGCEDDTISSIKINPLPITQFTPAFNVACTDSLIKFNDNSIIAEGSITQWYWNTGLKKDTFTTAQPAQQVYTQKGNYDVQLQVVSNEGCSSIVKQQTIELKPRPVAHFLLPDVCLDDAFANFIDSSYFKESSTATLSYQWNFGDPSSGVSNTSTLKDPKHKYLATGVYPVNVLVTSSDGCFSSLTQGLTVNGAVPKADFIFVATKKICSNEKVEIKNTSTVDFGNITRIEIDWDVNDPSSPLTIDTDPVLNKIYSYQYPTFNAPASKTYLIRMKSFSGGSCVDDVEKTVTIYSMPKLSMDAMSSICLNAAPITITAGKETASNAGTFAYTGVGITDATGKFDPATAGTGVKVITYAYTTSDGCADSIKGNIKVLILPVASYSLQTPVCDKNNVVFKDQSTSADGKIIEWQWNYGDGDSKNMNSNNAQKLYAGTGQYTVTLKVLSDSGCLSNAFQQMITVSPLPTVNFDLPGNVCLPAGKASFINKSTVADGSALSYAWNFGEPSSGVNNTSAQKDPVHYYSGTTPKAVQLIVTSAIGCKDSLTKTLSSIYPQPHVAIQAQRTNFCVNETVAFNGVVQNANGNVNTWNWSVGTQTFNTPSISISFSTAGGRSLLSYFIDEKGCNSDTVTAVLKVNEYPVVGSLPTQYVLEGGSVQLKPSITGNIKNILWSPALYLDTPTIATPTSSPLKDVLYKISVTGEGDCITEKNFLVKVLAKPEIPNVFTPNGDGINDTWVILYLDSYPDCTVEVFDRYGRIIYRSKGYPKPWDGKVNGQLLNEGTYYYIIDPKKGRPRMTGSITVLK